MAPAAAAATVRGGGVAGEVAARLRELADALEGSSSSSSCCRQKDNGEGSSGGDDSRITTTAAAVAGALQELSRQLLAAAGAAAGGDADAKAQLERSYAAPTAAAAPPPPPQQQQQEQQRHEQLRPERPPEVVPPQPKKLRRERDNNNPFDFARHEQRFVALEVAYVGWHFHGFARQADTEQTVEAALFAALRRVRLIPDDGVGGFDPEALTYSRCGRTDKGVSALGQVVALRLRSAALKGRPLPPPEQELDYCASVNKALPDSVRVLGWADAPPGFSARFSARSRTYKYFLPQDGTLDLAAMRAAAARLVGDHDFRNFCKADVLQVRSFRRRVLEARIERVADVGGAGGLEMHALHIKGTAFLWHQVRCIAAVLLMVGRGLERPEVVSRLLDVAATPAKPQYALAAEEPLLLYACEFGGGGSDGGNAESAAAAGGGGGLAWRRGGALVARNLAALSSQLQAHLVAAALTGAMFDKLQRDHAALPAAERHWQPHQAAQQRQQQQQQQQQQHEQASSGERGGGGAGGNAGGVWRPPPPPHVPLLQRATEPSIEERFAKAGLSLELLNAPPTAERAAQRGAAVAAAAGGGGDATG